MQHSMAHELLIFMHHLCPVYDTSFAQVQAGGQVSASLPDYSSMPSGSGLVPGMPMRMPWLPPATMDTSRDSIRRPPAA